MSNGDRSSEHSGPGANTTDRDLPTAIGPYRVLELLGEGGMALVYLAEQVEPVRRRVALKILKAGMDSKQIVARFESERQALAVLDHPHIAKIYDGGMAENGRPYFVMELVRGVPITDYCDDHRLANETRIRLFIDVCAAVQHAHHKGLIHRDLKPSNILVTDIDGKPQPKIIDFGIAKATTTTLTESTLFTRVGQVVGTPQYMSPEQADIGGIDVDTRTDIYSLGVILYELLVGTVPINLMAIGNESMHIALREKDPPKPSTRFTELGDTRPEIARARRTDPDGLSRQLRGDLDWVVMKAIEKDRTRRYETANALAMECHRFLNHEPVLARPPSAGYLLQRFMQRNRLGVAAASVALVAILAGATASTVGYVRSVEAEARARNEAAVAEQVSEFLIDLFEVSDPSEARGNSVTAREILDKGVAAIDDELGSQPEVHATIALTMAKVYKNLGLYDAAADLLNSALQTRRQATPDDNIAIADVLYEIAEVQIQDGDYDGAEHRLRDVIERRSAALGPEHVDVAHAVSSLAIVYYYQSKYEQSRDTFREALDVFEATLGTDHPDVINTMSSLGSLYWRTGDLQEAERLQVRALELKREYVGEDHPDVAVMMDNLAILLSQQGNNDGAERYYLDALALKQKIFGDSPQVANTMNNIGMMYWRAGQLDASESMLSDAMKMWTETLGADNLKTYIAASNLSRVYVEQARYAEAEVLLDRVLAGRLEQLGDRHEEIAITKLRLCDLYLLTDRLPACGALIDDILDVFAATLPEGHRRIAAANIRKAFIMAAAGQPVEAERLARESYQSIAESLPDSAAEQRARTWLGRLLDFVGKPEEAARLRD